MVCNRRFIILVVTLNCLSSLVHGKILERCELVRELINQGFPNDQLSNWVCMIEEESGRDTAKKTDQPNGGLYRWGLFQIDDAFWCGKTGSNECNTDCESLITDDITTAATCAKKIYDESGFNSWPGWVRTCKQGTLRDVTIDCPS